LSVLLKLQQDLPALADRWDKPKHEAEHPQAAVLVALTDEAEPRVLLGRRAAHLPLHPGEVAFAGGKREQEDSSPWHTAARETMEEVGLPEEALRPLGKLPPLVTRTGFEVFPCVASVPSRPELVVDPGEFDSVFFTPLATFADQEFYRLEVVPDGAGSREVPHYELGEDNIWGVTAAMLVLLVNVAYDAGLDLQHNWK
jgi:8-oxo-dGTP pyrophosphatase MutT (NUDIX family)